MPADQVEIQPVEQIVRAVAAAQAHDGAGARRQRPHADRPRRCRRSRKIERPALEDVLAELRRIAECAQGLQAALDALGLRRGGRSDDAEPAPGEQREASTRIVRSSHGSPSLAAGNQSRRAGEDQLRARSVPGHGLRAAGSYHGERRLATVQRERRGGRGASCRCRKRWSARRRARRCESRSRCGLTTRTNSTLVWWGKSGCTQISAPICRHGDCRRRQTPHCRPR